MVLIAALVKNIMKAISIYYIMLVHQLYSESPKIRAMQVKETAFPNINFAIPLLQQWNLNWHELFTRRFCPVLAVTGSEKQLSQPRTSAQQTDEDFTTNKRNENATMGKTCKFNTFASNNSLLAAVKVCRKTMESRSATIVLSWHV